MQTYNPVQRRLRSKEVFVLAGSVLIGAFIVFCDYYAVAPNGSEWILTLQSFAGLAFLLAFVHLVIGAAQCCRPSTRRRGGTRILVWLFLVTTMISSLLLGHKIRMDAFSSVARRSAPLIAAIKTYEADHGFPPVSLDDLVPKYLARIPRTGMGALPHYDYRRDENWNIEGNSWFIQLPVSRSGRTFDEFFYYPLQNYPASKDGNSIELIADWAYVHTATLP